MYVKKIQIYIISFHYISLLDQSILVFSDKN